MFPDRFAPAKKQGGFLIPLAAIIVVGLAVLALAISRISSQTGAAAVQEGVSVQAFYAAESGAQIAMNQLFFNAVDRVAVDGNCSAVSGSNIDFNVPGLDTCSTSISCEQNTDAGNTASFYLITSAASCGSGNLVAERTIQVSAYMQ